MENFVCPFSESCSVMSDFLLLHGLYGQNTGVEPFPSPGDLPDPGIEPRYSTLQVDSLPAELQGKPKNTGVGSLSLLQRSFLTQGSNRGLLHCRRILYQLSHQGSPFILGRKGFVAIATGQGALAGLGVDLLLIGFTV